MSMKGVLSTMKRRLSGNPGAEGGGGGGGGGAGAAAGPSGQRPSNIMRGGPGGPTLAGDPTPRADVTLPRRERR